MNWRSCNCFNPLIVNCMNGYLSTFCSGSITVDLTRVDPEATQYIVEVAWLNATSGTYTALPPRTVTSSDFPLIIGGVRRGNYVVNIEAITLAGQRTVNTTWYQIGSSKLNCWLSLPTWKGTWLKSVKLCSERSMCSHRLKHVCVSFC